jgi:hypothetical protein
MYHAIHTSLIGPEGHTGWYVVADAPPSPRVDAEGHPLPPRVEDFRRQHGLAGGSAYRRHRWKDRWLEGALVAEWLSLIEALPAEGRSTDEILRPWVDLAAEWWMGDIRDIEAKLSGRQGRQSTERHLLCVAAGTPSWRIVSQRAAAIGAPIQQTWGVDAGANRLTLVEQHARLASSEIAWAEGIAQSDMTLEQLETLSERAEALGASARNRIERIRKQRRLDARAAETLVSSLPSRATADPVEVLAGLSSGALQAMATEPLRKLAVGVGIKGTKPLKKPDLLALLAERRSVLVEDGDTQGL